MNSYRKTLCRLAGFTLVEIMIVVLIIGILLAIAVPNMISAREQSRAKACIGNLKQIDTAKQQWLMDNKADIFTNETWSTLPITDPAHLVGTYIRTAPICPEGGTYNTNGATTIPTCSLGSNGQGAGGTAPFFPHSLT